MDHRGIVVQCAVMEGYAGLRDACTCNAITAVACVLLTQYDLKGQSSSLGWVSI